MNNLTYQIKTNSLEIAIIGMAGRFPGAKTIDDFWYNLKHGIESVTFFNDEELRQIGIDEALINNPQYIKAGAKLENVDLFDANFFGFNPREAEIIDPQQRLFLECAWEALENAGYNSDDSSKAIGVYGGSGMNGYLFNLYTNPTIRNSVSQYQLFLASDKDFLTTRVSYKLNLEGPSVDIQTACSTSLVAVHIACQSLLSGECNMALAGGVAISKNAGYLYQEGGIYSPDGHCRAFDAKAQGTIGGSGVGIVVLKRLEDALADGDTIHAVIKGSAINNDGSHKVSYVAPRIDTQANVIRTAQIMAEVAPETITYIETHGTGTSLGDPIEIAALTQVFRDYSQKEKFCAIGSVKTNIGHLDAAAGIASLIKTVLALKYKQIPPSLNFEQPNPQIEFENNPFYVNTSLTEWQINHNSPRRAGVSSFGIGGTNAHLILEEAPVLAGAQGLHPQPSQSNQDRNYYLLVISAKTETALETATTNLVQHLEKHPHLNLADVAYTLQVGRRSFDYRRIVIGQNIEEIINSLKSLNPERVVTQLHVPTHRPVVFMFSGQGSQYINMGWELYQDEPIFRKQIDHCCELLKPYLGCNLRQIIYFQEEIEGTYNNQSQINETVYAQTALFVIEYALAQLWLSWGIRPEAMIGHSIGEYVAACLAGVFSLEDALKLVALRGKLMQQQVSGKMLSVSLSEVDIKPWLSENISLAANNAPSLCVVSGTSEAITHLQQTLTKNNIPCRSIHTSHAFHSQLMELVLAPFTEAVKQIKLNSPQIPLLSNVTGTWLSSEQATNPDYWAEHLRQTVRFAEGIATLSQESKRILLEIGPGNTLTTLAKQQLNRSPEQPVFCSMRHPKQQKSDVAFLLNTIGQLWLNGVKINWNNFYINKQPHRIPLPTYPFERQRYWIEPNFAQLTTSATSLLPSDKSLQNLKTDISDWFYVPSWERDLPLTPLQPEQLTQEKEKFCWLIFVDSYEIGSCIIQQLSLTGQDIITVTIGDSFTELDYRVFTIDPKKQDDYYALLEDISWRSLKPNFIIHLWSITKLEEEINFQQFQEQGFYSLLFLSKALEKYKMDSSIQMTVITNHLHNVIGEEIIQPEKATILGLCKVMPQEYPQITCRTIDIILPNSKKEKEKLSQQILAEVITSLIDLTIAYRSSYRWHQIFKPILIKDNVIFRENGIYLIIGDIVNSLGIVIAEHLAKTVQAKLIFITDSVFSQKIQQLDALKSEYLIIQSSITNEIQLKTALTQAEKHFGQINGVFYSTPMSNAQSTAPLQLLDLTQCEYNFQTKAYGLYTLANVLKNKQLDFYCLQSSLSSIIGGLGLAAYSAANCFIDSFAAKQNQNKSSSPWFTINWDACQFEEQKLLTNGFGASLAKFALSPSEVWQVFERVLSMSSASPIIVSKGNLQSRLDEWVTLKSTLSQEKQSLSQHLRPSLSNEYVAPRNETEQLIANIWQEILGIETVGIYDSFFDLGGHSLLAIQVLSRLRETFQIEFSMSSLLFETPTIASIATEISENKPKSDELKEIAELLEEVKNLSSEEIKQQLIIDEL